jgi:hypothetical protein
MKKKIFQTALQKIRSAKKSVLKRSKTRISTGFKEQKEDTKLPRGCCCNYAKIKR